MSDPFQLLGLEPGLVLDLDDLEKAYHRASREHHPDSGTGDGDAFARVNAARATLASPATRISAALKALGCSPTEDGGKAAPMAGSLMDLFAELGPAIQGVEEMAKRKAAARSELARALLAEEELAVRGPLEEAGRRVQEALDARLARLPELDKALRLEEDGAVGEARRLAHEFAFLERWQGQVRETLMRLFV